MHAGRAVPEAGTDAISSYSFPEAGTDHEEKQSWARAGAGTRVQPAPSGIARGSSLRNPGRVNERIGAVRERGGGGVGVSDMGAPERQIGARRTVRSSGGVCT